MTHHEDTFERIPAHLALDPRAAEGAALDTVQLLVRGQGTVGLRLGSTDRLTVAISKTPDTTSPAFSWVIDRDGATVRERAGGEWKEVGRFDAARVGLDPEPNCVYWFSFDFHNRALIYGKGEMRLGTKKGSYEFPRPAKGQPDPYEWFGECSEVHVEPGIEKPADVWRDPVTVEPPMYVLPTDAITMEQMAKGTHTVAANLTPICQQLYSNVAGERFTLETEDFPQFGDAIEESIAHEDGWCHAVLATKKYLRITMGVDQGESPGIPFVVEVWPPESSSPIHNHGASNAMIKVLRGQIHVSLFEMLSVEHQVPFAEQFFETGDVTWISPRLNQTHKLENRGDVTCVTIQCYMYDVSDMTHWRYFDYIKGAEIGHFDPTSDMDFLEFKATMKREWEARHGSGAPSD